MNNIVSKDHNFSAIQYYKKVSDYETKEMKLDIETLCLEKWKS